MASPPGGSRRRGPSSSTQGRGGRRDGSSGRFAQAPRQRAQGGRQFIQVGVLGQVIVGGAAQAVHLVPRRAARREHDDADGLPLRLQGTHQQHGFVFKQNEVQHGFFHSAVPAKKLGQHNAVYLGAGLGVNWAGGQQWNARTHVARPALINCSTCTHAIHRLFTHFSTNLPTEASKKAATEIVIPTYTQAIQRLSAGLSTDLSTMQG